MAAPGGAEAPRQASRRPRRRTVDVAVAVLIVLIALGVLFLQFPPSFVLAPLDRVEVTPASATLDVGDAVVLTARGFDAAGQELTDLAFSWTVSPEGVGTLDAEEGASVTFAAAAPGTVTVEARATFGGTTRSDAATITVREPPRVPRLVLEGLAAAAEAGTAVPFAVVVVDDSGAVLSAYAGTVLFSTSDPEATLPGGYAFAPEDQGRQAFEATFRTPGVQSLTVRDAADEALPATAEIDVVPSPTPNLPPLASFTAVVDGLRVEVDASASYDPDGTLVAYAWSFGDGATASGVTAAHDYAEDGTYTLTLTVTDDGGATGTASQTVSVTAPPNVAPTASFAFSPDQPLVGEDVTFDASGSSDADGTIVSWEWDFGDGTTAGGETVLHAYEAAATYTVTLTVTDDDGATATASQDVVVSAPNEGPTASFVASPDAPVVDEDVTFDASGSTDPDGTIVSYAWDFGDGFTGSGEVVVHAYDAPATYTVTLTVTDDDGATATAVAEITVSESPNEPPDASFSFFPEEPVAGEEVTFDATESSDPDGEIVAWTWDFGDGSTAAGEVVTHVFDEAMTFAVTLTVTDDDGATDTETEDVTVVSGAAPSGRSWEVERTHGPPHKDAVWTEVLPEVDGSWFVVAENDGLSKVRVTLFRDDGGELTVVHEEEVKFHGDDEGTAASTPVALEGGTRYVAAFQPFGPPDGEAELEEWYDPGGRVGGEDLPPPEGPGNSADAGPPEGAPPNGTPPDSAPPVDPPVGHDGNPPGQGPPSSKNGPASGGPP